MPTSVLQNVFGLALGKRLPITSGEVRVAGLSANVTLRRDDSGVAYVEAESDEDAYFGLGFCQAQDRAFQIELLVRVSRGTLAEVVGPDALDVDRLARRVGFRQIARAQLDACDDAIKRQFDAFARGVNAGLAHGLAKGKTKCHELTLLGAEPSTFEPADIAGVLAFLSFALSSNWDAELARLRVLRGDGVDALLALEPSLSAWREDLSRVDRLLADAHGLRAAEEELLRGVVTRGGASNAWAISPARTATGRPILASDPHLSPTLPAPWYLAHVRTPRWAITGAFFVTQPVCSIGHSEHCAWGITAGHADNTDLFVEKLGEDGKSVLDGERFVPCEVRRETIRVKGKPDETVDVLITPRGPIVGAALGETRDALSIRGTWMAAKGLRAYQFHHSRDVDEIRAYFDGYAGPSEARVFADTKGNIAWLLDGDLPVRRGGHGLVPAPGWSKAHGWEDQPLPFAKHPTEKNPERGFVATANQKPIAHVDPSVFLGVDWLDSYRFDRIAEQLGDGARPRWTVEDCIALQVDRRSILTRELRGVFVEATRAHDDPDLLVARRWLEPWDGEIAGGSVAASIFEIALADLACRFARKHAPNAWRAALGEKINDLLAHGMNPLRRIGHLSRVVREDPSPIAESLIVAVRCLRDRFGARESAWRWGTVRPLRLRHPFATKPPMDRVFAVKDVPIGGDVTTVLQGSIDFHDPLGDPIGIPNLRAVIDVGAWENSRWSLAGGQSGNPCSPHFDDLLDVWERGAGVAIAWTREAVAARAKSTVVLTSR